MHWPIPLETLRPLVPETLEIDTFAGEAYVGVVPFAMEAVKPSWLPGFLAFNFLELNVRTYVVCNGQPGVYFFSLDAASAPAVWAARNLWGLPYFNAKMKMEESDDVVTYDSQRRRDDADHHVRYRVGEAVDSSDSNSLEFFFLERYLLFVERRKRMYVGQVYHTPYPAHLADVIECNDSMLKAAGLAGEWGQPPFMHYSPGVDVEVFALNEA